MRRACLVVGLVVAVLGGPAPARARRSRAVVAAGAGPVLVAASACSDDDLQDADRRASFGSLPAVASAATARPQRGPLAIDLTPGAPTMLGPSGCLPLVVAPKTSPPGGSLPSA